MPDNPRVSVIIPTTGPSARTKLLWRAIESAIDQEGVEAVPIVVLNGPTPDPALEAELTSDRRLRIVRLQEPSLPDSLEAGRRVVETPWFAELDDDDVFLPGALAGRLRVLLDQPEVDVVVSNGVRREPAGDVLHNPDMEAVAADPLRALTHRNWLLPGSWLARTESVGPRVFEQIPPFMECTYLAIQFATRFEIRFLQEPTVVWNTGTPASASKSPEYVYSSVNGLQRIMDLGLPEDIRTIYRRRVSEAYHSVADHHWSEGRLWEAWSAHVSSLTSPGGLKYLPFTFRLLLTRPRS